MEVVQLFGGNRGSAMFPFLGIFGLVNVDDGAGATVEVNSSTAMLT